MKDFDRCCFANQKIYRLSEVVGKGHWWDDVLNDSIMQDFMERFLITPVPADARPKSLTLTVMNPAGTGSLTGFLVEQLRIPYRYVNAYQFSILQFCPRSNNRLIFLRPCCRLGKINILSENGNRIILKTINIRRFKILPHSRGAQCSKLVVDEDVFFTESLSLDGWFENLDGMSWKVCQINLFIIRSILRNLSYLVLDRLHVDEK